MDDEFEVGVIAIPIHVAMMWAVILAPVMNDVCQPRQVRELAHLMVPNALQHAAHWAGHHYLRKCIADAGAPWLN